LVNETEDINPYDLMSEQEKAQLEAQIAAMQQLEAESWQTQDWESEEGDDDHLQYYLNTLNDDHEIRARANIQPTDVKHLITSFINDDDLYTDLGIFRGSTQG
jgi:hypothetical protein